MSEVLGQPRLLAKFAFYSLVVKFTQKVKGLIINQLSGFEK